LSFRQRFRGYFVHPEVTNLRESIIQSKLIIGTQSTESYQTRTYQ